MTGLAPQMPWPGSFWDQPLFFYVFEVPLFLFCVATGIVVALCSLAVIVVAVNDAIGFVRKVFLRK